MRTPTTSTIPSTASAPALSRRSFAGLVASAGLATAAGPLASTLAPRTAQAGEADTQAGDVPASQDADAGTASAANATEPAAAPSPTFSVSVYDFGTVRLHAFNTQDAISDVCYLVEGPDALVGIELPAFVDDYEPWLGYAASLGKPFENVWVANHPQGGDHLAGITVWGTQAAVDSITGGLVRSTSDGLAQQFGDAWDSSFAVPTQVVEDSPVTVAGIDFVVSSSGDTYDLQISAANAIYTHMLGKTVHSIIASVEGIDATIATLHTYQEQGFDLVLTSHAMPEGQDAVAEKIAYLGKAKELAESCASGEEWQAAMRESFPGYTGDNYLEMSAASLFPQA